MFVRSEPPWQAISLRRSIAPPPFPQFSALHPTSSDYIAVVRICR